MFDCHLQYVIALVGRNFVASANSGLVGLFLLVIFFLGVKCLAMMSAYVVFGLLPKFVSGPFFHPAFWFV